MDQIRIVVLRDATRKKVDIIASKDISDLKTDIALIQSVLEQKLSDGKDISKQLEASQREKKSLSEENTRLKHRIAYLEDQAQELQRGMQEVSYVSLHTCICCIS